MVESCLFDINEASQVLQCHTLMARPVIVIMFISALAILGLTGLFVSNKKKFWVIWLSFALIFGVISAVLYFSPDLIQIIGGWFI